MNALYDKQFQLIFNKSQFSNEAEISIDDETVFVVRGFYCSGTYGERSEARYIRERKILKDSFHCAKADVPYQLKDLVKKTLVIEGRIYQIDRIYGNESGVLTFELVKARS